MNRAALEATLHAHPEDTASWLVYADLLQTAGDPHGELIILHHRMQTPGAERVALRHRERQLFDHYGPQLLGGLHVYRPLADVCVPRWQLGYIHHARVQSHWDHGATGLQVLEELLDGPSSRFLQQLDLGNLDILEDVDFADAIRIVASTGPHLSLSTLRLGAKPSDVYSPTLRCSSLGDLAAATPHLRALELRLADLSAPALPPQLEALDISTDTMHSTALEALTGSQWPHLTRLGLRVWLGTDPSESLLTLPAEALPALTTLSLAGTTRAQDLPDLLADSALLPQLHTLDLTGGQMSDQGAHSLLRRAEAFVHLKQLTLDHNTLSAGTVQALHARFGDSLSARRQRDPEGLWESSVPF